MSTPESQRFPAVSQRGTVSDNGSLLQVGGNYEEHRHAYLTGWLHLRAVPVDADEIDSADRCYVGARPDEPDVITEALTFLEPPSGHRNVLVLLGAPGTGRRTAALKIMRGLGLPAKAIHTLELDWDVPRVAQVPCIPGVGYVLDLSSYRNLRDDFYSELGSYQRKAAEGGSYLIILATPDTWRPAGLTGTLSVQVKPPAALQVAKAHLGTLRTDRVDWLEADTFKSLLGETAALGEGARLAWIIAAADESEDGPTQARDQFQDWQAYLTDWFAANDTPEDLADRALLIAAALLDGAPAAVVMDAADKLFLAVQGRPPIGRALAGRDLDMRLAHIGAARDGDAVSLDKQRSGMHHAVLKHIWKQRPQLRSIVLDWASKISTPNGAADQHLRRIAEALTQLARGRDGNRVVEVLTDWINADSTSHHQLAVEVLGTLGLDPELGIGVRRSLYDWARHKGTTSDLARAVAEVCSGPLGQRYPHIALTRLRLLAAREDGRGADSVAAAIRSLAADPEVRPLVLSRVVEWAQSPQERTRHAGATAFLALTDLAATGSLAQDLAEDLGNQDAHSPALELFARGWRSVWRHEPTAQQAKELLASWLDLIEVPTEFRADLAEAIARERLGDAGVSELLLEQARTPSGREVRELVLSRLLSRAAAESTLAVPDPVTE